MDLISGANQKRGFSQFRENLRLKINIDLDPYFTSGGDLFRTLRGLGTRSLATPGHHRVHRFTYCERELGKPDESTFHYVFAQPMDQNREITLTVLAFDIPKAVPEGSSKSANP